jgi:nucleoside-diphosphate-sugar epimerase
MLKNYISQAKYSDIFPNQFLKLLSNIEIKGNILITGSNGMLGNALACAISELQEARTLNKSKLILCSRAWDPKEAKNWQNLSSVEIVTNSTLLNRHQSVDFVIHAASPSNITKINTINDLQIPNLDLLKTIFKLKPKKILYISSSEVYGGGSTLENQHSKKFSYEMRRDWYPLIKLETEGMLCDFGEMNDIQTIAVRLFHTYGPGLKVNDGRSFADILWGAVNEKRIILKSKGTQTRTFLHISDAVSGILKILFNSQSKQITLNLGSDIPLTISEFAKVVSAQTGASIEINVDDTFKHSSNEYIIPDLSGIKNFNWEPIIDINNGIANTIQWMQKQNNNFLSTFSKDY